MKPSLKLVFAAVEHGLLRCAAQLVPCGRRADWLREWKAELWHVRQERAPMEQLSWQAEREIACFCLGAFQDATCLSEPSLEAGAAACGAARKRRSMPADAFRPSGRQLRNRASLARCACGADAFIALCRSQG